MAPWVNNFSTIYRSLITPAYSGVYNSERHERVVSVRVATSASFAVVAGGVRHKVECRGNYNPAVELVNRLRPGAWTEMVIVNARTALIILALVVVPAH